MRYLVFLAGIISLCGCNFINSVRLLNANDDIQPHWTGSQASAQLSSHFIGEQLFVEGSVNGEPGYRFLVDTGASIPCLMTTDKVKKLELEKGYEIEIGGNGNESDSPSYTTHIAKFSVGPASFKDMTFCVIPIETTGYYIREDEALFDGVIGTQLFDHFAVQIDARQNKVMVFKDAYQPGEGETKVNLEKSWGKYEIDAEISLREDERQVVKLIVDTGSRNYLKLNDSLLKDLPVDHKTITAADFGLSGRNTHQRALIPGISIADIDASNIRANFIYDDDDDDYTYILGAAYFNHFTTTFDAKNKALYLKDGSQLEQLSNFNLVGLQLRKTQTGLFVIRNVIPELPAAKFDFAEGDLVTSINTQPSQGISLAHWLELSSENTAISICRTRAADERCYKISPRLWYQ